MLKRYWKQNVSNAKRATEKNTLIKKRASKINVDSTFQIRIEFNTYLNEYEKESLQPIFKQLTIFRQAKYLASWFCKTYTNIGLDLNGNVILELLIITKTQLKILIT